MAPVHTDHLGDVVQVQAPVCAVHTFVDLDIGIQDAFIADAFEKERRQHQATVHALLHRMAGQAQGVGHRRATGRDDDAFGRHTFGDELLQGFLTLGRGERRPFSRGAKQSDTTAARAYQAQGVGCELVVVDVQLRI